VYPTARVANVADNHGPMAALDALRTRPISMAGEPRPSSGGPHNSRSSGTAAIRHWALRVATPSGWQRIQASVRRPPAERTWVPGPDFRCRSRRCAFSLAPDRHVPRSWQAEPLPARCCR
jgi:hypothetical protein